MFDRLFGVSTGGLVIGTAVTPGGDCAAYVTSRWLPVLRALKKLAPGPDGTFVDLGSGKGTVLLLAALLPFSRVIGWRSMKGCARLHGATWSVPASGCGRRRRS
jgi:hypothetical protein